MHVTRRTTQVSWLAVLLAVGLAVPLHSQRVRTPSTSLAGSPVYAGKRVEAKNGVVTSANGLASEAGLAMLRAGGNAVDAAVATAFAIGVVEPQMSGLGGSGAAVVWMKRDGKPAYLDFYAAQPADSWRGHTEPAPPPQPAQSGSAETPGGQTGPPARTAPGDLRVVGIPGEVAGLLAMHERYGTLPRAQVMAPAIRLADDGFPVGQILADFIQSGAAKMKPFPEATGLYFPGGRALAPGDVLRNPQLAASLRRVAEEGRKGFYEGPTAEAVVAALNAGRHPATLFDLAAFLPQWKRPLCGDYRGLTVLSAAPPQTGFQVLHTLELLEPYHLKALGLPTQSAAAFDVLASALRVGQSATRANADPNWVAVPANGLASAQFAAERKTLVGTRSAAKAIAAGDARPFDDSAPAGLCGRYEPYGVATPIPTTSAVPQAASSDPVGERLDETDGETTHLSVVDKDGNAVSLTQTNSSVWGSGGFAAGFFLNDSGFRFTDENIDAPSTSRWRIRTTTISPTIVIRNGSVEMVLGAPGGGRIVTEIVQVMSYVLDHGLDPLDAVALPRVFPSAAGTRVQIEHGFTPELLRDIRAMGYDPVAESAGTRVST